MDDLITWLRAAMEDDERRSRKLLADAQQNALIVQDPSYLGKFMPGWHDWPDVERMCTERLADIGAKRAILGMHEGRHWCSPGPEDTEWRVIEAGEEVTRVYPCLHLRVLALPFADRPGYREDWRP